MLRLLPSMIPPRPATRYNIAVDEQNHNPPAPPADPSEWSSSQYRETVLQTAKRCLDICCEKVQTPEGDRYRNWEEIAHGIMREVLGWGGQ